ncbi:MAG: HNH endonuclease signature motif containing protein [Rhodanobacteraceae bacterium]
MKRNGHVNACSRCGYSEVKDILVVHHKDRNRTHNDLANLEVLCPNCHSLEHLRENHRGWNHRSTKRSKTHPTRRPVSRS